MTPEQTKETEKALKLIASILEQYGLQFKVENKLTLTPMNELKPVVAEEVVEAPAEPVAEVVEAPVEETNEAPAEATVL